MKTVKVNDVYFGGKSLALILGPCVIESRDHSLMMAESICEITNRLGLKVIFKSSFDKANRSSFSSFRGLGIDKGLSILHDVKKELVTNFKFKKDDIIGKLDLVTREEFEILKKVVEKQDLKIKKMSKKSKKVKKS